ncbi:MAG: hypothetical protein ACYDDF_09995 [Thermoplasmatota archaeon]
MPPRIRATFLCSACGLGFDDEVDAPFQTSAAPRGPFIRAFWCPREEKFLVLDVNDLKFAGRCPDCSELLDLIADFPLATCPRCHAPNPHAKAGRTEPAASARRWSG